MSSAINSVNNNSQFQSLVKESAKDGKIEFAELTELFGKVQDSKISPKEKQEMYMFFQELSNRTVKVEGSSQKELTALMTDNDIKTLKQMAPKNNIAKLMLSEILKSQSDLKSNYAQSNPNVSNAGDFEPNSGPKFNLFDNLFSNNKPEAKPETSSVKEARQTSQAGMIKSKFMSDSPNAPYLRSQTDSPFKSKSGDCGPTSVIMMLRANGVDVDLANIGNLRKTYGAPDANGGGPFAASFKSLKSMAETEAKKAGVNLKGGDVSSFGRTEADRDNLVKLLRSELKDGKMPLLCTGQTPVEFVDAKSLADYKAQWGKDFKPVGRHYTMVVGVNDNGTVRVADPGGGNIRDYSPEELLSRMNGKDAKGNPISTEVMSFQKLG